MAFSHLIFCNNSFNLPFPTGIHTQFSTAFCLMLVESEVNEGKQLWERHRRKSDSDLCVQSLETVTFMRLQQAESSFHHERERRQHLESEIESKTATAFVEDKDVENITKTLETDNKESGNV